MGSTQFSVREASERVGISRQTMFRHIKDGKVSATANRDGQKQIELSELLRVFGELQQTETKAASVTDRLRPTRTSHTTTKDSVLIQVEFARLQAQLEIKTAELDLAKERINELKAREHISGEEKNRLLSLIERQSLLLAAPKPQQTTSQLRSKAVKKVSASTKAKPKTAATAPRTVSKPVAKKAPVKTVAKATPVQRKTVAKAAPKLTVRPAPAKTPVKKTIEKSRKTKKK